MQLLAEPEQVAQLASQEAHEDSDRNLPTPHDVQVVAEPEQVAQLVSQATQVKVLLSA